MASSLAVRADAASKPSSGCPTDDLLLAFIPGQLAPEEASSVTVHLETCAACQSRLTTLRQRGRSVEPTELQAAPSGPPSPALPSPRDSDTPTTLLPPPRPRIPQRIGQYELLKQIGRGGMGLVYLARHQRLRRIVALKLLPGLHQSDKSAIVRLQREIAAAGRVQHPNIVFATDANAEDGIDYLVMEHIAGIDIGRLVATVGPLPCPDACEIIRQAALGVAHIHACGLVHRDLKPSNLMLATDGVVKVLDLGLALLREGRQGTEDSATQTGYLLGTADYVSPEQLHDPHDADVRSDLYSLGCTFYKLLTGQAPFGGSEHSSLAKKLDAHRYSTAPSIRSARPEVSADVEVLLARLLAKEPNDRLQEPAELAELLAPLAAGADLTGLYQRAGVRSDLDDLPPPGLSHTPHAPDASTHSQGRTPTPTAMLISRPRRRWPVVLTAIAASALVAGGIWAGLNRGGNDPADDVSPSIVESGKPPAPPAIATGKSPLRGLAEVPVEMPLPDIKGIHDIQIDERLQMIRAEAESIQLIRLGDLQPGQGTIKLDFQFVSDHGAAGLFFGYREENVIPGKLWGVGDFIYLAIRPRPTDEQYFELRHYTAQVRPNNRELWPTIESLPVPLAKVKDRKFHLEIDFAPTGLTAVRLNGLDYSQVLDTASASRKFQPAGVFGTWGLYNNGSTLRVFQPTLTREPQ